MDEFAIFEDFAKEIRRIISNERKIPLRILGGAAIRMHSPKHEALYEQLKRDAKPEMDFVTYAKSRPLIIRLLGQNRNSNSKLREFAFADANWSELSTKAQKR